MTEPNPVQFLPSTPLLDDDSDPQSDDVATQDRPAAIATATTSECRDGNDDGAALNDGPAETTSLTPRLEKMQPDSGGNDDDENKKKNMIPGIEESPRGGTFDTQEEEDTENADFEILPDDEDDQQQQQKLLQMPGGSGGSSEELILMTESEELTMATSPTMTATKGKTRVSSSSYDSPPSSPTPGVSPGSSPRRSFIERFSHLAMSPKRPSLVKSNNNNNSNSNNASPAPAKENKEEGNDNEEDGGGANKRRSLIPTDMKSPLPAFKAMRAKAAAVMANIELPDAPLGTTEEVFSSDDEYSDDNTLLSMGGDDSFVVIEDDMDNQNQVGADMSTLSHLPVSFLDIPPDAYDYLDSEIVKNIGEQDIAVFAWEHHLLVKGLLQLLAERDHIGVEDDVHVVSNILKMGPLKRRFAQLWFVKFVELRKGNLSFYDDSKMNDDSAGRRTIHLRKRTCTCQAVTTKDGGSGGFVFELTVEGGPKRLWMAKSEEERQGWIRAINQAMIGDNDDSPNTPLDLAPYQSAIEVYQSVQASLKKEVKTRQEYMVAVDSLLYRQRSSSALRLPVNWIRENNVVGGDDQTPAEEEDNNNNIKKPLVAAKREVRSTISEYWENLCSSSVEINGYLVEAKSTYSAERIIGAVSRCILEFDKVEERKNNEEINCGGPLKNSIKAADDAEGRISELQALSYGRSIIRSILKSKIRRDAFTAVEALVRNELVSCVPVVTLENAEPIIHIDVSFAGDDFSEDYDGEASPNDISGWIWAQTKKSKNWKERYFVIAEGVLSFFEKAEPRPSGLRGQRVLADAKLKVSDDKNIIGLQTKDRELRLKFDNRSDLVRWKTILERATELEEEAESHPGNNSNSNVGESGGETASRNKKKNSTRKRAIRAMKGARSAGIKQIKGAKSAGIKKIKSARSYMSRGIGGGGGGTGGEPGNGDSGGGGTGRHRPADEMLWASTRALHVEPKNEEKRDPRSVQVCVEFNTVYKVVARSENDDDDDALLIVRAKVFQAFLLSGGPNGRLAKGDELLEMEFIEDDDLEEMEHEFLEPHTVL